MYSLGLNNPLLDCCPRCGGLLYVERLAYAYVNIACAICGNRLDATILQNRLADPIQLKPSYTKRVFPLAVIA